MGGQPIFRTSRGDPEGLPATSSELLADVARPDVELVLIGEKHMTPQHMRNELKILAKVGGTGRPFRLALENHPENLAGIFEDAWKGVVNQGELKNLLYEGESVEDVDLHIDLDASHRRPAIFVRENKRTSLLVESSMSSCTDSWDSCSPSVTVPLEHSVNQATPSL